VCGLTMSSAFSLLFPSCVYARPLAFSSHHLRLHSPRRLRPQRSSFTLGEGDGPRNRSTRSPSQIAPREGGWCGSLLAWPQVSKSPGNTLPIPLRSRVHPCMLCTSRSSRPPCTWSSKPTFTRQRSCPLGAELSPMCQQAPVRQFRGP
jgi:hypothetical protein